MNLTTTNPKTTKHRYWFRFRLRTLLVMVTLLSVLLGWVGWELDQRRKEKEAVAWISEIRGFELSMAPAIIWDLGREMEVAYSHYRVDEKSWWEKNTDKWFGSRMRDVILIRTPVSDLTRLTKLKKIELLVLDNSVVTDLSPLAELKNLKYVFLKTPVSDEQAQKLRLALPNCDFDFCPTEL